MTSLHITRWGDGEPVVLVHGSMVSGRQDWFALRPLADRGYELLLVDRRGYGKSPEVDGEDFLRDADDIAELLADETPDGAHLVGASYGGIVCLYAANQRPELVRSLTVMEPPAFAIVDDPAAQSRVEESRQLWGRDDLDDRQFLLEFVRLVGSDPARVPDHILDALEPNVPVVRAQRPVWEADPPLAELAEHDLPVLVVSGGHHDAFDAVCDHLE